MNVITGEQLKTGKKNLIGFRSRKKLIFYCLMLAYPILQFVVFYIGVNFNSFFLAFKRYTNLGTGESLKYVLTFDNFKVAFYNLFHEEVFIYSLRNSLLVWVVTFLMQVPVSLLFSYYIYKKMWGSKFFRVVLFIPSMICSVAISVIFTYFVGQAYPQIARLITGERPLGLLDNPATQFPTLLFFSLWLGFGTPILMYTGAMSGIDDSVIEAAKMDGVSYLGEFLKIVIPMIYPTISVFVITGIANIFLNQLYLYNFFGIYADAHLYTYGYYLYRYTTFATTAEYPLLSAYGLIMSLVAIPLTFLVKFLAEKFGPGVE